MSLEAPSDKEIQRLFDTPDQVPPGTFDLALVLGGTVSSGAYTAGVLDFLIEALDTWARLRNAGAAVPSHTTRIRFLAGTSGGGVNAAIFARAMNYAFEPVSQATTNESAAGNPFYNIWVNHLNLADMLTTTDLDKPNASITSLLNSDPIDQAADAALSFTGTTLEKPRPWLPNPLRLCLTLTNLNGMPYTIDFGSMTAHGTSTISLRQSYVDHADYARFAVVYSNRSLNPSEVRPDEAVLGFDNPGVPNAMKWKDFGQYALATAAFPVGLKPRMLNRPLRHYQYRLNDVPPPVPSAVPGQPPRYWPMIPDWDAFKAWSGGTLPETYTLTSVDGGVCDNEPIQLARTFLSGISGRNPRKGDKADRAVLLIDPFAGSASIANPVKPDLVSAGKTLISSVTQQIRYDTRDILLAADPDVFSRFMITAQRDAMLGDHALATAGLGAFLGFASSAFRRHDYLLGRQNCQTYLRHYLVLPEQNQLFDGWKTNPDINLDLYRVKNEKGDVFLPIIPLTGACTVNETLDDWPAGKFNPETLRAPLEKRFARLVSREFAKGALTDILTSLAGKLAEQPLSDYVIGVINDALKEWKLDHPSERV